MKRWQALEVFNKLRGDTLVVHGTGEQGAELQAKSPSEMNIYMPLPYPTPFALGLALALPQQRIWAMEGDGSALSGLSSLTTVSTKAPPNLIQIVWDNGAWLAPGTMGTRGHYGPMPTATAARTDLAAVARAAGYPRTATVDTLEDFEGALRQAMSEDGPSYIVAKVERAPMPGGSSKAYGTTEQAIHFRRALIDHGWVAPGHAGLSVGKWLAPDGRQPSAITMPDLQLAPETGPRPSLEKARTIYSALRESGIDTFIYLPDSAGYLIQRLAAEDPQVTHVSITREDEGLAIAFGAFMGGRNPAMICEASGLGLCPLAFAILGHEQRLGTLILYSHTFTLGEVRDAHACTKWITDPLLDALMIPHITLMDIKDAPLVIKQAWRTVRGQMTTIAIGLPLHTIWDE